MGKYRLVNSVDIGAIALLHEEGHSVKVISKRTGVAERSVQRWLVRLRECGEQEFPHKKRPTGRPKKTHQGTLNIIKQQVDERPNVTAKELKESNPQLLGDVRLYYMTMSEDFYIIQAYKLS